MLIVAIYRSGRRVCAYSNCRLELPPGHRPEKVTCSGSTCRNGRRRELLEAGTNPAAFWAAVRSLHRRPWPRAAA